MSEEQTPPSSGESEPTSSPAWRPFGYADPRSGTTEAAGALMRTGPATETAGGVIAGDDAAPGIGADDDDVAGVEPRPGADVAGAELPAVLVPDDEATRAAESHPNVAAVTEDAPNGGDAASAASLVDVAPATGETGADAGAGLVPPNDIVDGAGVADDGSGQERAGA